MSRQSTPNILHLISSSGLLGAEQVLLQLAHHSQQIGLSVTIGVVKNTSNPHVEVATAAEQYGIKAQIFLCRGRFDKETIHRIREYIQRERITIVHSHNYKSNFYAYRSLPANEVSWVVTHHGRRSGIFLLFYGVLDTLIIRRAHKIVTVSPDIYRRMIWAGIPKNKICVIDNGIDIQRFSKQDSAQSVRTFFGIKKDAVLIGTIGSLTKEKGHRYLVNAIPAVVDKIPHATFLFVGDGSERHRLQSTTEHLRIENHVLFAGTRSDIPDILAALDVFVLPSLREGLPLALLEAQAAQVPVIATCVGAIEKVLDGGQSGILVPPRQSKALSDAILDIINNRESARHKVSRGFTLLKENYSSKTMARNYITLYQQILTQ